MWTANYSGPFCPRSMPGTAPCVATRRMVHQRQARPPLHLGRRQDLGGVDRLPLEAALDPHQEAARLLHRHPGRGRRGVPEVASPTDGRAGGGHSRRAGDPQAGRTHAGDARAAASPDCHLKWSGVPGWRSRQIRNPRFGPLKFQDKMPKSSQLAFQLGSFVRFSSHPPPPEHAIRASPIDPWHRAPASLSRPP